MHNVNVQNLNRDDLLQLIQDAQTEMIGRYTPDMGEGVTQVTDAIRGSVFYSDVMDEAWVVGSDFVISVSSDGGTSELGSEDDKLQWTTGWTC